MANPGRDPVPDPRERGTGGRGPQRPVRSMTPVYRRSSAPWARRPEVLDIPRTAWSDGAAERSPEDLEGERSPGRTVSSVSGIQSGAEQARTRRRSKALKRPLNRSARHPATEVVFDRALARRPGARRHRVKPLPVDLRRCVEDRRAIGGPEPICRRGLSVRSSCASRGVRPEVGEPQERQRPR
jgi:hypothetical protein